MFKFKVGDKVIIKRLFSNSSEGKSLYKDKIYIVNGICSLGSKYPYSLKGCLEYTWSEQELDFADKQSHMPKWF